MAGCSLTKFYPIQPSDCEALKYLCGLLGDNIDILEVGCGRSTELLSELGY